MVYCLKPIIKVHMQTVSNTPIFFDLIYKKDHRNGGTHTHIHTHPKKNCPNSGPV